MYFYSRFFVCYVKKINQILTLTLNWIYFIDIHYASPHYFSLYFELFVRVYMLCPCSVYCVQCVFVSVVCSVCVLCTVCILCVECAVGVACVLCVYCVQCVFGRFPNFTSIWNSEYLHWLWNSNCRIETYEIGLLTNPSIFMVGTKQWIWNWRLHTLNSMASKSVYLCFFPS